MATRHACELFHKEDSNPDQLYEAMQECTKVHNQLTKEAAMGELVEWCRKLLWWRYFYLETKWHDILHVTLCFTWRDILHVTWYFTCDVIFLGQGWDRHLFAMKYYAEKKGYVPPFFQDPNYLKINRIILSTSTVSSPALQMGGFGPVIPEGYGVGECHTQGVQRGWVSYLRGMV